MAVTVHATITGTEQEIAKLQRFGVKLHDFSRAMQQIGDLAVKYYSTYPFNSNGGVFGTPWPALNPIYAKRKAVGVLHGLNKGKDAYPGRNILVRTGVMQGSFIATPDQQSVTISNTAPYFKYHESTEPRTKIPYRPMLEINNDVKGIIEQVIKQDIQDKIASY